MKFIWKHRFMTKENEINRILDIGFVESGEWEISKRKIKRNLYRNLLSRNILYSFVVGNEIKYIGKTINTFLTRMYGYESPGKSQETNKRIRKNIKEELRRNKKVKIFVLAPESLLKYGDFSVNLAAGLEDSLIAKIKPNWNFQGKTRLIIDKKDEEIKVKNLRINTTVKKENIIKLNLSKSYYSKGFFNIKKEHSDYFGADKNRIEIYLGRKKQKCVKGYIDRTSNSNNSPRIHGGKELKEWLQNNFDQGSEIKIGIISKYSIIIFK
ncbi:MAG: hypothetical protein B6D44_04800 [Ignavibacteriales bacterium UTCHB2]|nr:MAG: hypothetical protein B6D44_04800 [Ignavibacteriales bacterium UTCHB2]